MFTENAKFYFNELVLRDYAASLQPLGAPTEFTAQPRALRGDMIRQNYHVTAGGKRQSVYTFEMPDGKLEQFTVK